MAKRKRRRGNGEGTIVQRSDGRFMASVLLGTKANGKPDRRCVYGASRDEVQKKLRGLLVKHDMGMLAQNDSVTVGDWLLTCLMYKEAVVEGSTIDSYRRLVHGHLIPGLGAIRLTQLRPAQIKKFYFDLDHKKLSSRTRNYIHHLLKTALKEAVRMELIPRNVAEVVKPEGKKNRKEIKVWSAEEIRRYLKAGKGERLLAAYYLAINLGLRRGEVLGLHWQDVDFEARTVHIKWSLRKGEKGKLEPVEPKTSKSRRKLYVAADVMDLLCRHKQQQDQEREIAAELWQENGLVFTTTLGTWIHPDNFKRPFQRICQQAGLEPITLHGLRHSYTSLAFKQGVLPKVISERLGHEDVAFTMRIYQHIDQAQHEEAALSMADLLGESETDDDPDEGEG